MLNSTIVLATPDLQIGDLVHEHGMRIRLDTEPIIAQVNSSGHPVYAWVGTVENLDEVLAEGFIPAGWLVRGDRTDRWNVQGNRLARWRVERDD